MHFLKLSFLALGIIVCQTIEAQFKEREHYASSRAIECIATCDCDGIYPDYCAAYLRKNHPVLYWAKQPPCLLVCFFAYLNGWLMERCQPQDTSWRFENRPKGNDFVLEEHED